MKLPRTLFGLGCLTLVALGTATAAHAHVAGITSDLFGSSGCNQCHTGGTAPKVSLTGPTTVAANSTSEYLLQIRNPSRQQFGGLNVSASDGTLATGGTFPGDTQTLRNDVSGRDEVTHTRANPDVNGVTKFTFLWTAPGAAQSVTLVGWGNAVNGNGASTGDKATKATLSVMVLEASTPTPTLSPPPTATTTLPDAPSPTDTPTKTPLPTAAPTDVAPPTDTPTAAETPTETATETASPTAAPTAMAGMPGDANCDGTITAADMPALEAAVVAGAAQLCGGADVNRDQQVNEDDITALVDLLFQP